MSALVSGLIGGVVAASLGYLSHARQKAARVDKNGWKGLYPGWLLHGTLGGCTAFVVLMIWLLANGGSTRPDAGEQNLYAIGLALFFASASLYVGWFNYGRSVKWRANEIWVRNAFGREAVYSISDIRSVTINDVSGTYRLKFKNGFVLAVSTYLNGTKELVSVVAP